LISDVTKLSYLWKKKERKGKHLIELYSIINALFRERSINKNKLASIISFLGYYTLILTNIV